MADKFKKCGTKELGPGGHKCPCCGPAPKDRKVFRRRARRRLQHSDRKLFKGAG